MKEERKIIFNESGITLIALVVTIVVLLILAAVSIGMLTGENGIIKQAQEAKLETRGGDVEERVNLWKGEHKLNDYSEIQVLGEADFIQDLKNKKLVFDEEINTETKTITIGSREIYYGLTETTRIIKFTIDGYELTTTEGTNWKTFLETYNEEEILLKYPDATELVATLASFVSFLESVHPDDLEVSIITHPAEVESWSSLHDEENNIPKRSTQIIENANYHIIEN